MYALKGFVAHNLFPDNTPDAVAVIGELSKKSLTYSRESGQYVTPTATNLMLTSFLSSNDGTKVVVPAALADQALKLAKFIYDRTMNDAGQQYSDEILADLIDTFDNEAEDFSLGGMVTDGTYWVPSWMSWKSKNQVDVPADNSVRLWFADESFQLEYDNNENVIVPPVDRLDDFFKTAAEVEAFLKNITTAQMVDRLQNATVTPATVSVVDEYDYVDPFNPQHKVKTPWGQLIYGMAGNNIDTKKDALTTYILANSTHPREDWIKIFPDLFKRTEMIIVPRWDKMALPNRATEAGVNSPVAPLTSSLTDLRAFVPGYPQAHINLHAAVVPFPYKSLHLLTVGGPENRDNLFTFGQLFGDYIDVSSQAPDFNRMSVYTKQWVLKMESLLRLAEIATEFSSLPQGYTRTKRDGKLYVVANYEKINYLVAMKSNFA